MDAEIKKKWVGALRSGEYKQATGALRENDGFCCLGVLCDVLGANWRKNDLNGLRIEAEDESYLDEALAESLGLSFEKQRELAKMNDGAENGDPEMRQYTFSEIANHIEKTM